MSLNNNWFERCATKKKIISNMSNAVRYCNWCEIFTNFERKLLSIWVTLLGIVNDVRELQLQKALFPKWVILLLIVISVSDVQWHIKLQLITFTLEGIFIHFRDKQLFIK